MTAPNAHRPERVCENCWRTFRAAKPQSVAIHCPHAQVIALLIAGAWQTEPATDWMLLSLRAGGLL